MSNSSLLNAGNLFEDEVPVKKKSSRRRSARRSARRSTRRSSRRVARRSASRTGRRTARRTARRSARRSARRTTRRSRRVDAVSDILSAAYGIQKGKKKQRKMSQQTDVDSFLKGIESSGPYNLDKVFKGDDKGNRVAKRGPAVKKEETTGPLDPAAIPVKKKNTKKRRAPSKKRRAPSKKRRVRSKKQSEWITHVKAFYNEKRKKDPNYKYSQALKEAKDTYKAAGK